MYSFVETIHFTRLVKNYLTDDEYAALQVSMIADPEVGTVIPGLRGVRKLRWRAAARGKRGGYRVIYFARRSAGIFWMLTMYPKSTRDNMPAHALRQIRQEIENE